MCGTVFTRLRDLNHQFQNIHKEASLLIHDSEELLEKDFQELEDHDNRVSQNVNALKFIVSQKVKNVVPPTSDGKNTASQSKSMLGKLNRTRDSINSLVIKIDDAVSSHDDFELEDIQKFEHQLFDNNRSLEELLKDMDLQPISVDDSDGDNLNDQFNSLFELTKTHEVKLSELIKVYRRD